MEIIYKSKEYSEHLISLSGETTKRKLRASPSINIRNCVELIEEATEMLNIPQKELIGGPGELKIFVSDSLEQSLTIESRMSKVISEITCKGKSFNEVKTKIKTGLRNMDIYPLSYIAFQFGIEREDGGWSRSADFEREEEIKKPIEFLEEMQEKIPFTAIANIREKDIVGFFKKNADQKGIFGHTGINLHVSDSIYVEWQISLFYKPL